MPVIPFAAKIRVAALSIAVAACSMGPLGETVCACAEEYFAYADINRWKDGADKGRISDMAALERYYRAKGWHTDANDLFARRVKANDPMAIGQRDRIERLKHAAAKNDIEAIQDLRDHYTNIGQQTEERQMNLRLVELGDSYALGEMASELFNEATNLSDQSPAKMKKLLTARNYYRRIDRQDSFMDATTLRGAGLSHLLRPEEYAVDMQTLVEREIERLER
jgi:hypothetical protein